MSTRWFMLYLRCDIKFCPIKSQYQTSMWFQTNLDFTFNAYDQCIKLTHKMRVCGYNKPNLVTFNTKPFKTP